MTPVGQMSQRVRRHQWLRIVYGDSLMHLNMRRGRTTRRTFSAARATLAVFQMCNTHLQAPPLTLFNSGKSKANTPVLPAAVHADTPALHKISFSSPQRKTNNSGFGGDTAVTSLYGLLKKKKNTVLI